jgi:Phage integrase, N-terminal SAM-like domain
MGADIGAAKASRAREGSIPNPKLKWLDQVGEVMRFKPYSLRTETTCREWIRRFIRFRGKRYPREMGPPEVERFLSGLAVTRQVAASTQNQAFAGGWGLRVEGENACLRTGVPELLDRESVAAQ